MSKIKNKSSAKIPKVSRKNIRKINEEDKITKSKQLQETLKINKAKRVLNKKTKVKYCSNGKPMPSLSELKKMYEDHDDTEDETQPNPSCSQSPSSIDEPESLINKIANKMLDFISNLTESTLVNYDELSLGTGINEYDFDNSNDENRLDIIPSKKTKRTYIHVTNSRFNALSSDKADQLKEVNTEVCENLPIFYNNAKNNKRRRNSTCSPSTTTTNVTEICANFGSPPFNTSVINTEKTSNSLVNDLYHSIELPPDKIIIKEDVVTSGELSKKLKAPLEIDFLDDDCCIINPVRNYELKEENQNFINSPEQPQHEEPLEYKSLEMDLPNFTFEPEELEYEKVMAEAQTVIAKYSHLHDWNKVTVVKKSSA